MTEELIDIEITFKDDTALIDNVKISDIMSLMRGLDHRPFLTLSYGDHMRTVRSENIKDIRYSISEEKLHAFFEKEEEKRRRLQINKEQAPIAAHKFF